MCLQLARLKKARPLSSLLQTKMGNFHVRSTTGGTWGCWTRGMKLAQTHLACSSQGCWPQRVGWPLCHMRYCIDRGMTIGTSRIGFSFDAIVGHREHTAWDGQRATMRCCIDGRMTMVQAELDLDAIVGYSKHTARRMAFVPHASLHRWKTALTMARRTAACACKCTLLSIPATSLSTQDSSCVQHQDAAVRDIAISLPE